MLKEQLTRKIKTLRTAINLQLNKSIIIGRSDQCDIRIPNPQVSGRHAKLTLLNNGKLLVEDLESLNGTFVNGERVARIETSLESQIAIGFITIDITNYRIAANSVNNTIRLDALNLSFSITHRITQKNVALLENISLSIFPFEIVALMGPSGAGKSTLLDILSGDYPPTSGELLLNGDNLFGNFESSFLKSIEICSSSSLLACIST